MRRRVPAAARRGAFPGAVASWACVTLLLGWFIGRASGLCTCVDDFDYFSEIYDEQHYNYTGFPYLEYHGGLNSVIGPWYRSRTAFLFQTQEQEVECYAPESDNCNLAFQTFYRYLWTVKWIYDSNDKCPLPGQTLINAIAGVCDRQKVCGTQYEEWDDMSADFLDFTTYFFHCLGPGESATSGGRGARAPGLLWTFFLAVLPVLAGGFRTTA